MKKIRIMLADDHRMFVGALSGSLATEPDIEVVAIANSGYEALAAVEAAQPDILVLDIGLPDISGVEVANRMRKQFPHVGVIALSGYADRLFVEEMLKAGARSYVVKSAGVEELLTAIRAVAQGKKFLCTEATGRMLQVMTAEENNVSPPITILSRREQEVLRLLSEGVRTNEIAAQLGITGATVEVHRRNLKEKLGIRTVAELTRYAIRHGLSSTQ
ncbi:MAG: hypothetical protein RIR18_249 [Pseudomonadota bacterium]|jgi:two-component system NarL family response regulator